MNIYELNYILIYSRRTPCISVVVETSEELAWESLGDIGRASNKSARIIGIALPDIGKGIISKEKGI